MDELFRDEWVKFGLMVVIFGSVVDIFQFFWVLKRGYRAWKRAWIRKVKRQILWEDHEKKENLNR